MQLNFIFVQIELMICGSDTIYLGLMIVYNIIILF